MRVVMLTTSWPRDDTDHAGRFLVHQVRELRRAGCEVEVLSPGRGFDDHGLAYGDGIVANARRRPWRVPLMLASMVSNLRRAAREADLVHAHWLLVAPVAALGGRPLVLSLHGSGTAGRFSDLELAARMPRLFRWLVRRARVVVAVSPALEHAALAAGADARLVPHGVDVPEVAPAREAAPDAQPVALFAGRLSPEKGVEVLAEAFAGLEGVRLVVAGDGVLRPRLPATLGFVSQERLHALYEEADMLVMPSLQEGFGVVALEAMSHGVPVVASRVGGLSWLVGGDGDARPLRAAAGVLEGDGGLLVAPGDPTQLRRAVELLRDELELRERLGRSARARAAQVFGWGGVTARTMAAYRDAADRH